MTGDKRKLARLQRLERVRAIAKQTAAMEAAKAENTLAQLQALAARSTALAADYAGRSDAQEGAELRRFAIFASQLQAVCRNTGIDAARAQALADQRQRDLTQAERRRAVVAERAAAAAQVIAAAADAPALGARRVHGK